MMREVAEGVDDFEVKMLKRCCIVYMSRIVYIGQVPSFEVMAQKNLAMLSFCTIGGAEINNYWR